MFAPVMSSGHPPADCFNGFDNFDSSEPLIEALILGMSIGAPVLIVALLLLLTLSHVFKST